MTFFDIKLSRKIVYIVLIPCLKIYDIVHNRTMRIDYFML